MTSALALSLCLATPAATANPDLQKAIQRVRELHEAEALVLLDRAQERSSNSMEDLAMIALWRGLAWAGLSEEQKAEASFEAALRLQPSVELPPLSSPRVQAWWAAAKARLPVEADRPVAEATLPQSAPQAELTQPPPAPAPIPARTVFRRAAGTALLAAGVLAIAVALWAGSLAGASHRQAESELRVGAALALQATASAQARASTGLAVGGGVGLAAGAVLWSFDLF